MGRPALAIGSYGTINIRPSGPGRWEAKAKFRDFDGRTKQLRAGAATKSGADRALKARIAEKVKAAGMLTDAARVSDLIDQWLDTIEESTNLSTSTKRLYRLAAENHVRPALGRLYLPEVTVPAINRCLRSVRDTSGRGSAKTARSVISGVLGLAVQHGALPANPARDAISLPAVRKSATRALTPAETEDLVDALRADQHATDWDLPDLAEWMLYTGCRIGEALAVRHGLTSDRKPLLDLEHGTWEVNATVVRITGQGLHIQPRTKTDAGWRVLALPPGAVTMLQRRADEARLRAPSGVVFGSPARRALRDPSNTSADIRATLNHLHCSCNGEGSINEKRPERCQDRGPFAWVTSHTWRKTVATRLDEAGVSARAIADQLGHAKPSMTQDVYMGRNVVNAAAAHLLDR